MPATTSAFQSDYRRFDSVDALRGWVTLLVVAAPAIFAGARPFIDQPAVAQFFAQLSPSPWEGLRYADFAMPAMIVLAGISITIAQDAAVANVTKSLPIGKIARRTLLLFALGVLYHGGFKAAYPDVRIAGHLQRIAICYAVTALVCTGGLKSRALFSCVALLVLYGLLLGFAPVPQHGAGNFSFEGNWAAYVDARLLSGLPYFGHGTWDPDGIGTLLPAIALCLAGAAAGSLFQQFARQPSEHVLRFIAIAAAAIALGGLVSIWLPLIPALSTPSFQLIALGVTLGHLAIFEGMASLPTRILLQPLCVVGRNSLLAYLAGQFLRLTDVAGRLCGGSLEQRLGQAGPPLLAVVEVALLFLLVYWFDRLRPKTQA